MAINVTVDSLLDKVKEITPIIREHAGEAEEARRLSHPVVEAMTKAGLYRMSRPKAFGGLELDPVTIFRVIEDIARHDSAPAWNLQISTAINSSLAWLPDEGAGEIMDGHPDVIFAGAWHPPGQATPVEGGYRLTGQWPYCSGINECTWFVPAAFIMDGDGPLLNDQGVPIQHWMWTPVEKVMILDTWHTMGMCATGSHDVAVSELFIPEHHTAPIVPLECPGKAYQGPLYRLTIWPGIGILAPPALGIARAAIDDLLETARRKTPAYTGSTLRERQVVQRQVAEAEATLGAGRAFLYETFRESWEAVLGGEEIDLEWKMKMQLAATHSILAASKAVDLVHAVAGGSGIRNEYRYQRYFRDVHTITQHGFTSASRYESVGALMLGEETDWGFFAM